MECILGVICGEIWLAWQNQVNLAFLHCFISLGQQKCFNFEFSLDPKETNSFLRNFAKKILTVFNDE